MSRYVIEFPEIDRTMLAQVGGKGAHLGELSRIEGVGVPTGFCVTTEAFVRVTAEVPGLADRLDRLGTLTPEVRSEVAALAAEIRDAIEAMPVPAGIAEPIEAAVARLGTDASFAVRSSATAEDLPTASFAGQQDSYLNVVGFAEVLRHVRRCWASLYTERAVIYRMRNGFDHRAVRMAVVVQRMVVPHAAGILFTADPVTGRRDLATIEASFGLGEALVAGLVTPDVYGVRDGEIVSKAIGEKRVAILPAPGGGTREEEVDPARRGEAALTDPQIVRLATLGRRIEGHFGSPQDIEWCLVDDRFHVVQSRPITTLFPIPATGDGDRGNRVYISVGHQQMMTDAMKPLGIAFWQMIAARPMHEAGGRLFVDVTDALASPAGREGLLGLIGKSDPLIGDALRTLVDRGDFIRTRPDDDAGAPGAPGAPPPPLDADPALVDALVGRYEAALEAAQREIGGRTGSELLDFIRSDLAELQQLLFDPHGHRVLMSGIEATWWLNDNLEAWLGEKNVADTLTRSAPHNVTSEMGLALLDVADAIRPHPRVVAFLEEVSDHRFLDGLPDLPGGREARDAILGWLDRYGMRCPGEIDITRPRWRERPSMLVPLILSNVRGFQAGEAARRLAEGREAAARKEMEVLERLRALPDGDSKADETERMIARVRTFIGFREYPKYGWMSRLFVYKRALGAEAERLVAAGVLRDPDDIDWLSFEELREVVRSGEVDHELIRSRRSRFSAYRSLTPPRVITSDGEMLHGAYRRDDVPADALAGLAVSAGTIEGRARVVLDPAHAEFEPGDILVTTFTDPSWTPLFIAVSGLVTEVGGLMTHGAVIAREYGLPAVVGVENATRLIRDGQRIRVRGLEGYVELLE